MIVSGDLLHTKSRSLVEFGRQYDHGKIWIQRAGEIKRHDIIGGHTEGQISPAWPFTFIAVMLCVLPIVPFPVPEALAQPSSGRSDLSPHRQHKPPQTRPSALLYLILAEIRYQIRALHLATENSIISNFLDNLHNPQHASLP